MPSPPSKSRVRSKPKKRKKFFSRLLLFLGIFVFFTSFLAGIFYLFLLFQLPNIKSLNDYNPPLATRIISTDGTVIGYLFKEKRILVSLAECPPHLIQAFVSSEDARFFKHRGVDLLSILRALWKNIWAGEIVQGGSTITQQVTKSLLLSPEKSLSRKIKEAVLSYRLDRNLSKEDILYHLSQPDLSGAWGLWSGSSSPNLFREKSPGPHLTPKAPSWPVFHRPPAGILLCFISKRPKKDNDTFSRGWSKKALYPKLRPRLPPKSQCS